MPIYEFRCNKCSQDVELLMKMSDPPPANCPSCHTEGSLIKRISKTSFVLKGGGWYETDFKTPPAPPVSKKAEAPPAADQSIAPAPEKSATEAAAPTSASPAPAEK